MLGALGKANCLWFWLYQNPKIQKFGGILPLKLSQLPHLVVCGVSETNLYQKSGTEDTDNVGGIMGFL